MTCQVLGYLGMLLLGLMVGYWGGVLMEIHREMAWLKRHEHDLHEHDLKEKSR